MHQPRTTQRPRRKWLTLGLALACLLALAGWTDHLANTSWREHALAGSSQPGAALFRVERRGPGPRYHPLPPAKGLWFPRGPLPENRHYELYAAATFLVPRRGRLALSALADDGVRLYLDGRLLAQDWSRHPPRLALGETEAHAGWHVLEVDYFQSGGGAVLEVHVELDGQMLALATPGKGFSPDRFKDLALFKNRARTGLNLTLALAALWLLWPFLAPAGRALSQTLAPLAESWPQAPQPGQPFAPWRGGNAAPLALYALAALAFTWPLANDLANQIPSNLGWAREGHSAQFSDAFIFMWNAWWHKTALFHGLNPFFCPLIFHPAGANLALHTHGFAMSALTAPATALFGGVAGYSLAFLLMLTATAYCAYLAARRLVGGAGPAWLAGFIFAFNPWHLGRGLGQMDLFSALFLPLFFWALMRTAEPDAKPRHWALAGAFLAANYWAANYHFLFALGFLAVFLAAGPVFLGLPRFNKKLLRGLGLLLATTAALSAPLWLAVLQAKLSGLAFQPAFGLPDLPWRLLFTRPIPHPLFSRGAAAALTGPDPQYQWSMYVGWPLAALCLLGLLPWRRPGRPWFWLMAGLFFAALTVNLSGLPGLAASRLPILKAFRGWAEFICPLLLCAAFLAAHGLAFLQAAAKALKVPRPGWAALAFCLLVLGFEFCPWPYPVARVTVPAFYRRIAADQRQVAVLELPTRLNPDAGPGLFMYFQTIDGKPRFGSHISRTPIKAIDGFRPYPELRKLIKGRPPVPEALAGELARLKVGWVVLDSRFYGQSGLVADLAAKLGWQPSGREGPYLFWMVPSSGAPSLAWLSLPQPPK